ncbi:hypothetical protein F4778DRAFT_355098 [Xylariomycetidae sp. FL2044]|nr:hypothetical protein F4778DRAFT_355098 [Xylariomycetidae sp. FL2044]
MTEKILSLSTHSVPLSQASFISPKSATTLPNHLSGKVQSITEEEPYTIKCICDFADDDGNTIYCDICDTWQHIECYYPHLPPGDIKEDFPHSCVECEPRLLDRDSANARQRLRQGKNGQTGQTAIPEKKPKRPPSKSHKKKTKPTDLLVNGQTLPDPSSKHNETPTHQHKKSKSTHRPSQSVSSQQPKRSPSYGQKTGNPHGHPPSPANTPPDPIHDFEIHSYSTGFLNLYKGDRDLSIVQSNSYANLGIPTALSSWLRDHDVMRTETGCDFDDVFHSLPPTIDSIKASPQVESKEMPYDRDITLRWQYLTMAESVDKYVPLVELNGQIGIQKNYCEDPDNRWPELSAPLPFVFFHPLLPIYIDTRKEGSIARYVRRSCRPNAQLDTFLSPDSEYRFWLVSERSISRKEQITIPWEFRLQKDIARRWQQLLGLGDDDNERQPAYNEKESETYQSIAVWIHTILSEYGGCACGLGPDCAFARFHRTYFSRPQTKEKSQPKKKSRKVKTNNLSPTSTGHATNSRAPSEGRAEDGADNDSGSSRSKPPSRDMTPARQGSFDTMGVLTELTDRDKRKVQMVEDSFRRMEQQQQPPRKKKRTSDGTANPGGTTKSKSRNSVSHASGVPNGVSERRYIDAGTTRGTSGSPTSAVLPNGANPFEHPKAQQHSGSNPPRRSSQGLRPHYRDSSVQTDTVYGEWWSPAQRPYRRPVPFALKMGRLEPYFKKQAEERRRRINARNRAAAMTSATGVPMVETDQVTHEASAATASADILKDAKPIVPPVDKTGDTFMSDAPCISPTDNKVLVSKPPTGMATGKLSSPELRVQLPPVPAFNESSAVGTATTPLSANGNFVHSPFSANNLPSPFAPPAVNGVAVHPSPIKKKLSLSDYTKSRMNKAAAAKPASTTLKPPSATTEEGKSPTNTDSTMIDSPVAGKHSESL